MTARLPEKRRDKRIDVALPVILDKATGVTRDVSASGVFFWISGMYALGDSISFSMGRKTESGKFMLKCRGDVLRVEPRGNEVGVAVRMTQPVVEPV
ncbi:MAG: PilZ domain-containing protein [Gammaproteobacteria bacterium]|nr:PilZ domain-containing protein [Gammaproteobacteria bacterium]MDH3412182.1 PilZ domain-containing protein [Gammaproteobacteria bacterium]